MLLPNLIIAGAPRCGTTSLFFYLSDHPEVCGANVKETYYFIDPGYPLFKPDRPNYENSGLNGYETYFEHCGDATRIWLDATPDYLYQQSMLDAIEILPQSVRYLFLLRKPSERVWSCFTVAKNNMGVLSRDLSFRGFLDSVRASSTTSTCELALVEKSEEQSRYITYLARFAERLPRERMLLYLYEDLVDDPLRFITRVCTDIGISPGYYDDYHFQTLNRTIGIRNAALHRLVRKAERSLPERFQARLFWRDSWVKRLYRRFNAGTVGPRSIEDQRTINELEQAFRPYNVELARVFGLDVTAWE